MSCKKSLFVLCARVCVLVREGGMEGGRGGRGGRKGREGRGRERKRINCVDHSHRLWVIPNDADVRTHFCHARRIQPFKIATPTNSRETPLINFHTSFCTGIKALPGRQTRGVYPKLWFRFHLIINALPGRIRRKSANSSAPPPSTPLGIQYSITTKTFMNAHHLAVCTDIRRRAACMHR
jgi:hypothetical protein